MVPEGYTLMKVGSHRAHDRLRRLVGERFIELLPGILDWPKGWSAGEGLAAIPDEMVTEARGIKGVSRSRFAGELRRPMVLR